MLGVPFLVMKRPHLLVVLSGIICSVLALTAIFYPAPSQTNIIEIIGYEIVVFIGIILLLCLINERGLPDGSKEGGKVWP